MNRALAFALPLTARPDTFELARRVIVVSCAAALILAGRAFPF
jgi:hypothetical protein